MKKLIYFCIAFFFLASTLHAQTQKLIFESISMAHGLSQHCVNAIIQDSTGFLWFATNDGLNKYDGHSFRIFKPIQGDTRSISGNKISTLLQDSDGKIWVGMTMGGGLNIFDPRTEIFTPVMDKQGKSYYEHDISDIFEDREGNVWIASNGGGLYCYNRKTETCSHYTHNPHDPTSITSNAVRAVSQDTYGTIWVGMDEKGGLNKFDTETQKFTPVPFIKNNIMSIRCDSYGQLWIGTYYGGFGIVNPKTGKFQTFLPIVGEKNSLSSNIVMSFYEDQSTQQMYVATREGGLNIYHAQTHKFLASYQENKSDFSITSNNIRSVYKDRSGVLWVGTENDGLNKCNTQRKNFKVLQTPNGVPLFNVHTIIDNEKNTWIGTRGAGLHLIEKQNNSIRSFYANSNSTEIYNKINCMIYDPRGFYWIGTEGNGIFKFDAKTERHEQFKYDADDKNSLSNNAVKSLFLDNDSILWIGTHGGGLSKFNYQKRQFTTINLSNNNERNVVWCIIQDTDGIMWIGTSGLGLLKFDPKTNSKQFFTRNATDINSLSHNEVTDILEDTKGVLWIGTSGGGVNKFDKKTGSFTTFSRKDGLANDVIASLQEANNGDIWIATDFGLARLDPNRMHSTNYYKIDGLAGNSFNQGARYKNEQGELFFGGRAGVTYFIPDSISNTRYFGNIVLTDLRIFNQSVAVGEKFDDNVILTQALRFLDTIILSYKYSFSIEFANLNFIAPEKIQYKYKLDGFDNDWLYTNADKRFATYTNLAGGTYTFKVMATNTDGEWGEQITSITIIIIPPFWRTTWFYSTLIVLIIGAIYSYVTIRERNLIAEKQKLEEKVNERTKEIEEQKELLSKKNEDLLHKNILINDSINYAKRIQDVVFPQMSEVKKYLPQSFVFFKPRDIVSGDFYWILEQNDDLYIAVADSTGHGVPGALLSLMGTTLLNEITHNSRNQQPVAILEKMNKGIIKILNQHNPDQPEIQDDSVDITLCKINKSQRTVHIVSAQQTFFHIAPNQEIDVIHGDMTSIGGTFNNNIEFTNREFEYEPGASFYLFSDGFCDQFGGAENKKYQTARFKQLILDMQNLSMDKQFACIETEFDTWKNDNRQTDDVLVIGFKLD
ncbi:MAG: SpoIIE family protein phosphatase [Bacteroidetes bacterium]|nr:SpoIIE family protein phosphatase [Bacteroidota bacterium]